MKRFKAWLAFALLYAPFWRRSWRHRAGQLGVKLVYGYLGILLVLLFLENWLLFHAMTAAESWAKAPPGAVDVTLDIPMGGQVHAWWLAGRDWSPRDGALLFFHGNGGNLSHRGVAMVQMQEKLHLAIMMIDYPGYGKSTGRPSEAGCYAAADAAYEWLTSTQAVPVERVVLYGGSLGGAVAADLASRQPCRALILVSTFTSFPEIAQSRFPWLPARWLVHNQLKTLDKLAAIHAPIFIAHSVDDGLIPIAMGRELYDAANTPKEFFTMEHWRHCDNLNREGLDALQAFLEAN